MIKLTEIRTSAGQYNPETQTVDCSYTLRNVYINPKFIISMTDNERFNEMHKSAPLIKDLMPEARFTKLALASGTTNGFSYCDILGCPEQHFSMMTLD